MKLQFLAVAAAAALMAAPTLHAQATTPPQASITGHNDAQRGMRPRGAMGRGMMANLNLTADQKAKMKAIRTKYEPQMKAARDKAKPDFDAMKAARASHDTAAMRTARARLQADMAPTQNVMKQQMTEMRAILTPEQQQKMDSARVHMKGHMGGRGFRSGMGTRPAQPVKPASAL
jgi:Spy/CpxP family protein refolding chaperone